MKSIKKRLQNTELSLIKISYTFTQICIYVKMEQYIRKVSQQEKKRTWMENLI